MAIVYINSTPSTVGAVIQPAPLSVTATLVTLDDLDLTGIADGTIYIAFEADGGQLSNWFQATKFSLEAAGDLVSEVATVDSSGNQVLDPIEGSGDPVSDAATLFGTGDVNQAQSLITGTGDLASQEATFAGDGDRVIYQTGSRVDLLSQDAQLSGTGSRNASISEVTAALQAQGTALVGVATVQPSISGSGDLVAGIATLSGVGNITTIITGTGDLAAEDATFAGSGFKVDTKIGTGDLQAIGALVAGAGNILTIVGGNGVLVSQAATALGTGFKFAANQTVSVSVPTVEELYGTPSTYVLNIPRPITTIEFIWSSDDPEYINGNLSVQLSLIDSQGELVLASMNAQQNDRFTLYDAEGADSLNRFQRLQAALLAGATTIRISGYDDIVTHVVPFAQDGGLMIHNVDLAA